MKKDIEASFLLWVEDPSPENANAVVIAMEPECRKMAKRRIRLSRSSVIDIEDLMQEGNSAIMQIMSKHRKQGEPFTYYALRWMSTRMIRCLEKYASPATYRKNHQHDLLWRKYGVTETQIKTEFPMMGKTELLQEMSKRLNVNMRYVMEMYELRKSSTPMDTFENEEESSYANMISAPMVDLEELYDARAMIKRIAGRVEKMKKYHKYPAFADNILNGYERNKMDIAINTYGITKQYGHQIDAKMREKLLGPEMGLRGNDKNGTVV